MSFFLAGGCGRDTQGTRLLELTMPVIEFDLLPGAVPTTTFVVDRASFFNEFPAALADNSIDPDEVDLIGGLRARVVSLNGEDFGEFERIDVRACPVGTPRGCENLTSVMFSQGDLFRRRDRTVDLSPSLVNFRELILGSDRYRFELTFRSGAVTSRTISGRLEWAIMGVGDLD